MSHCRKTIRGMLVMWTAMAWAVVAIVVASAQAACSIRGIADGLASSGFYDEAITEYKRHLFFSPDDPAADSILSAIGRCYACLGDWESSLASMDLAVCSARDDSTRGRRIIDRVVVHLAADSLEAASRELSWLVRTSRCEDVIASARHWLFLTQVLSHRWEAAWAAYQAEDSRPGGTADTLSALLAEAQGARQKSAAVAAVLSMAIPGAGQAYSGAYSQAINALVLNSACGYAVVSNIIGEHYFVAFLAFELLFQRYYLGNIYQSRRAAVGRNSRIAEQYESRVLESLRPAR
jgi:tetratricopeptide (TPR) repeat protein